MGAQSPSYCGQCGAKVEPRHKFCPSCGTELSSLPRPEEPATPPSETTAPARSASGPPINGGVAYNNWTGMHGGPGWPVKPLAALGVGIALLIIVGVVFAVVDGDDPAPDVPKLPNTAADEVSAKDVCNQFVKRQLSNPESADFQGLAGMGGDGTRLPGPTPQWTVISYVDSKTDLGITKRIAFDCTVEHLEGARWNLIDLDLTDLDVK